MSAPKLTLAERRKRAAAFARVWRRFDLPPRKKNPIIRDGYRRIYGIPVSSGKE